jgi:hypothetical protein
MNGKVGDCYFQAAIKNQFPALLPRKHRRKQMHHGPDLQLTLAEFHLRYEVTMQEHLCHSNISPRSFKFQFKICIAAKSNLSHVKLSLLPNVIPIESFDQFGVRRSHIKGDDVSLLK